MILMQYGLLVALALALVFAAASDIHRRKIGNGLNAAIALGAPFFWWASGMALWPDVAWQLGFAVLAFAIFVGMFAAKLMGGGDVKLLTALALWIEPLAFMQLLVIMALVGGLLAALVFTIKVMRKRKARPSVPYGVAIAAGALWVLAPKLLAVPVFA
jgi:prepilin peptidase CpaA